MGNDDKGGNTMYGISGRTLGVLLCSAAVVASASGCASNGDAHLGEMNPRDIDLPTGGGNPHVGGGIHEQDLGGTGGMNPAGLSVIYFDYNSSVVRADAVAQLQRDAERLKRGSELQIQIEGHCDERGTQEYNLALGEERAIAIMETLVRLGVEPDRLATISYGEERPAATGETEDAWSKNRRVELIQPAS